MSAKVDSATGVVSVAIFGIQAALSPNDFAAWSNVITAAAPAILILFLLWRIYRLDKQHASCVSNQQKTQDQLTLAYRALIDPRLRCNLPNEDEFIAGNFCLPPKNQEE
jgi:hypothetical protein